jgi:hypothetical protein
MDIRETIELRICSDGEPTRYRIRVEVDPDPNYPPGPLIIRALADDGENVPFLVGGNVQTLNKPEQRRRAPNWKE